MGLSLILVDEDGMICLSILSIICKMGGNTGCRCGMKYLPSPEGGSTHKTLPSVTGSFPLAGTLGESLDMLPNMSSFLAQI